MEVAEALVEVACGVCRLVLGTTKRIHRLRARPEDPLALSCCRCRVQGTDEHGTDERGTDECGADKAFADNAG